MLQNKAIQTARALLEQTAADRHRELRVAFPGYFRYLLYHIFALPYLAHRGWRYSRKREELDLVSPRLSGGTPPPKSWRKNGTLVIGTDLGEARTAVLAVEQIRAADPETPIALLVTMKRSFEFAMREKPSFPVGYLPFNNPLAVLQMLNRWKPARIIFSHHNLDNHHITYLAKWRGVKTVIVNASLTESDAARRHRQEKQRGFIAWRRTEIGAWAVQTEIDRQRFLELGVDDRRILVTGPIYASLERTPEETQKLTAYWTHFLNADSKENAPVIIAGSTYPPEEEILLQAFRELQKSFPAAILVLAPRALNREGGAGSTLEALKMPYVRRSQVTRRPAESHVVLLDTFGELKDSYTAATAAHVGGSFDRIVGSHTPVEPLAWGVPMTMGPHYTQQAALVDTLAETGLLTLCHTAEEIADTWKQIAAASPARREQFRQRSEKVRQSRVIEEVYRALLQESAEPRRP